MFGQSGCLWVKLFVLGQSVCIPAKVVVFGQSSCVRSILDVFVLPGCIWVKLFFLSAKWLHSGKTGCIRTLWLYSKKSG